MGCLGDIVMSFRMMTKSYFAFMTFHNIQFRMKFTHTHASHRILNVSNDLLYRWFCTRFVFNHMLNILPRCCHTALLTCSRWCESENEIAIQNQLVRWYKHISKLLRQIFHVYVCTSANWPRFSFSPHFCLGCCSLFDEFHY